MPPRRRRAKHIIQHARHFAAIADTPPKSAARRPPPRTQLTRRPTRHGLDRGPISRTRRTTATVSLIISVARYDSGWRKT
jgi:hypothetical protein